MERPCGRRCAVGLQRLLLLLLLLLPAPAGAGTPSVSRDWSRAFDAALDSGVCNIPRVHASALSHAHFMRHYKNKAAVIIVGGVNNSAMAAATARPRLLQHFGHVPVMLSSANTYSHDTVTRTVGEYVRELMVPPNATSSGRETFYNFGGHNPKVWAALWDLYVPPPYLTPGDHKSYSFGMGASGSGVPFHVHNDGFSEVFHGRKRWFLYPPGDEPRLLGFAREKETFFRPDESSLQWLRHVYPTLTPEQMPLECVIEPGEALYFPSMWYHAIVNLQETVFISTFI